MVALCICFSAAPAFSDDFKCTPSEQGKVLLDAPDQFSLSFGFLAGVPRLSIMWDNAAVAVNSFERQSANWSYSPTDGVAMTFIGYIKQSPVTGEYRIDLYLDQKVKEQANVIRAELRTSNVGRITAPIELNCTAK